MSDEIKHECGIAFVRLLKPLSFYKDKYDNSKYGLSKLCLMMEKQKNRGQDGAGIVNLKLNVDPGHRYISRIRSNESDALSDIFNKINLKFNESYKTHPEESNDPNWLKSNLPFTGEIFLGHLRYGTYGKNNIENCHPFLRQNNWITKNLSIAGNFNLTNVDELFNKLVEIGQHPKEKSDTVTILEKIGHFLDEANEDIYQKYKERGYLKREISEFIISELNICDILKKATKYWDGGYVISGIIGHGDCFIMRDPNGIRPAFYYTDDEVFVAASERPAIQTAFGVNVDEIKEIKPGYVLIVKKNGEIYEEMYTEPSIKRSCSFERIYFSRGTDSDIYKERLKLGESLSQTILEDINYDLKNTVFSFIPNTAEVAFYGMIKGIEDHLNNYKKEHIEKYGTKDIDDILSLRPRVEKIAIKDAKLRTFISDDVNRNELIGHVYDTTYGVIKPSDTLVIMDDSIVRGSTLKNSILKILDKLGPKKIIFVSSSPQIRYPDCYGIDMAKIGDFIAFKSAMILLKENKMEYITDDVYNLCLNELKKHPSEMKNIVKKIYEPFSYVEISDKISEIIKPNEIKSEIQIIYQTIDNLHKSCPDHLGDWYFTGDYPTPGGNRVVNQSFVNFMQNKNIRSY